MSARAKIHAAARRIFGEEGEEESLDLPQVRAARERDRLARERVESGADYKPTRAERLEFRAWKKRMGRQ